MPTVKVNMAGQNPEDSLKSDFAQPPPGVHRCKIKECTPGKSKRSNNPMLTVVLQPVEGNYGQVWYYPTFSDESFPKRKMDQFLMAVGVLTKTKRQASFNTDTIIGKQVDVNFRAKRVDENTPKEQRDEYRAEVTDVWAPGEADTDEFDASGGDPAADEEFDAEGFEEEEEDTEEPVEGLYSRAEIEAMDAAQLKEELKEYEVKIPPRVRAPKLAELLLKAQADYCESEGIDNPAALPKEDEEDEDEEDADEEEMTDDDEDMDDDDSGLLTKEQLEAKEPAEIKVIAKEFDLVVSGKKKSQVIAEILEAQGADEEPF